MMKMEDAKVKSQSEADKILKDYEEVSVPFPLSFSSLSLAFCFGSPNHSYINTPIRNEGKKGLIKTTSHGLPGRWPLMYNMFKPVAHNPPLPPHESYPES
jgi:hypothetical protein